MILTKRKPNYYTLKRLPCLLAIAIFFQLVACRSDTTSSGQDHNTTQITTSEHTKTSSNTTGLVPSDNNTEQAIDKKTGEKIKAIPPKPKPSAKRITLREEKRKKSVFRTLDCCVKQSEVAIDCCCDNILKEYKKLLESNFAELAEIKLSDPFFEDCKSKTSFAQKIDAIEEAHYGEEEEF